MVDLMDKAFAESVAKAFAEQLTKLAKLNPGALESLIHHRVPIVDPNGELPFVVAAQPDGGQAVGMLGIINGLLYPTGFLVITQHDQETGAILSLDHMSHEAWAELCNPRPDASKPHS